MLLCIDVGLRNLSLCIMTKHINEYSIHLWDNYDLMPSDIRACEGIKKSGGICCKVSSLKSSGKYYCKTHGKGLTEAIIVVKKKLISSYTLQEIVLIVLDKITSLYKMDTELFQSIDKVCIEKQPRINNKMQLVSNVIFTKLVELLPTAKVRFISASKKLKIGPKIDCVTIFKGILKGAKGYSNRKNLSVTYTKDFLTNSLIVNKDFWICHFEKMSKKNDMADSLCFCVSELS